MSRGLTTTEAAEVASNIVGVVRLLKIALPAGTLLLTDSDQTYTFNGDTYTPDGRFGSVSQYSETADLKPHQVGIQISGLDAAVISGLMTNASNAWIAITFTIGFIGTDGALLDTPTTSVGLYLGDATITLGKNTGSISISGENVFADMQGRKSGVIAGDQDQQLRSSGDTFFSQLSTIINKTIYWGGKSQVAIGVSGGNASGGIGSFGIDYGPPGVGVSANRTFN